MSQQLLLSLSLLFGPATPRLGKLISQCGNNDLLHQRTDLIELYKPKNRKVNSYEVSDWWRWLKGSDWRMVSIADADYPALLDSLSDAPGVLYAQGNLALLHEPQIAIVGSRKTSPDGAMHAQRLAQELSQLGFVITSGLAIGIDACAHQGALVSGRTIAVLPCGPDRIYPSRHRKLAADILAAGGLLLSEFPPGTPAKRPYFPLRNRIISGLSLATLVVEAGLPSGSLVTARLAAEQGREVFAMPGAVHNPMSRGCHQLLKDGANWLEDTDDVLALLNDLVPISEAMQNFSHAKSQNASLLQFFNSGINHFDTLIERTGLDVQQLNIELTELELAGKIKRMAGGYGRC